MRVYYPYSEYLKTKYNERVYKLPIHVPGTCPNRDGTLGTGGCAYCAGMGAGYELLSEKMPIKDQLKKNRTHIGKKYHAEKFIAYFQNYSGTYVPADTLYARMAAAVMDDIVAINISTRPDCVPDAIIKVLCEVRDTFRIDICIELGLQTANDDTLKRINRCHTAAQFADAAARLKSAGIAVSAHVIPDLPFDTMDDVVRTARLLSNLGLDGVKLHSLYIAKDSAFETQYKNGELELLGEAAYIKRAIAFLEHLSPDIYVERLIGRVPEANSLVANFNRSWWAVRDDIVRRMTDAGTYQGIRCSPHP